MMGLSVEFGSVITTPSEAELTARASRRFSAAAFCIGFELSPPLLVLPARARVGGALVPPVEV